MSVSHRCNLIWLNLFAFAWITTQYSRFRLFNLVEFLLTFFLLVVIVLLTVLSWLLSFFLGCWLQPLKCFFPMLVCVRVFSLFIPICIWFRILMFRCSRNFNAHIQLKLFLPTFVCYEIARFFSYGSMCWRWLLLLLMVPCCQSTRKHNKKKTNQTLRFPYSSLFGGRERKRKREIAAS